VRTSFEEENHIYCHGIAFNYDSAYIRSALGRIPRWPGNATDPLRFVNRSGWSELGSLRRRTFLVFPFLSSPYCRIPLSQHPDFRGLTLFRASRISPFGTWLIIPLSLP